MRDKFGNQITIKEFFSRWKSGIREITAFQQTKISLMGIIMMLVGVIWGLIMTYISKTYWLFTILLGSFVLVSMNLLANIQKYLTLKELNKRRLQYVGEKSTS